MNCLYSEVCMYVGLQTDVFCVWIRSFIRNIFKLSSSSSSTQLNLKSRQRLLLSPVASDLVRMSGPFPDSHYTPLLISFFAPSLAFLFASRRRRIGTGPILSIFLRLFICPSCACTSSAYLSILSIRIGFMYFAHSAS